MMLITSGCVIGSPLIPSIRGMSPLLSTLYCSLMYSYQGVKMAACSMLNDPYFASVHVVALTPFSSCDLSYFYVVPTTPACTWWNRPEEDPSSGKLESTHPSRTSVKYDQVFLLCRVNHACQRCLIRHPRCYYLDTRNFE